ncbi:TGF-beta-activated kinase 1 and MAP3K7-binding protein like [Melia azedarach]|uniref:TGF-beta-activated kinase 1 and MAP3K7-binding protein like n=1 Tax=Melia azedarach TaxID=155640 RepID=A0ACC1X789_MELAZ|nr:TGF-beta-activated kinase 1 and MAP3K7-binding protein like [Melia azedarach]
MAAAYSLPYSSGVVVLPSLKRSTAYRPLQVKAQSFRDEGRLSNNNIVDANMKILKERIEKVQIKERLEKCCRSCEYGWNYASGYDYKFKRDKELGQLFQLLGLVGGTITFTCLSGTLFLCLLSLLPHLIHH